MVFADVDRRSSVTEQSHAQPAAPVIAQESFYEIQKLRIENQKLMERLAAAGLQVSGEEDEDDAGGGSKAAATRQRPFEAYDRLDNLYFGTPGRATIVREVFRHQRSAVVV
ncbi:hypothetical protein LTR09_012392 [Extremus antarcticus]|uniref:Uncharacterized protein n=1 Tax=Extremus antarcticus TaxID=702011 RepID=A0AAJ0D502_9PEZI|nr:hypothetical protein LTR09_012392 [Extremus antarcticus]